jgi:hypothetical protein
MIKRLHRRRAESGQKDTLTSCLPPFRIRGFGMRGQVDVSIHYIFACIQNVEVNALTQLAQAVSQGSDISPLIVAPSVWMGH